MAVETDEWRRLRAIFQTIHDETVDSANTAARIGDALLALLPYIGAYIRKDQPDSTNYLLTLLAGAVIGNSAIHLNPDGSIECGSLSVKGSAIFDEIISNHQSVLEGDTYFTNKHTVEHVEDLGFGNYRLTFRKEYENDIVTYRVGDILRQAINNLDKKRTYYNTWSRVTSVDLEANTADVLIYQDSEVDGGKNYPPEEGYLSIRWGNNVDKERQSLWLLSSTYKRLEHHWNVDQPILRPDNYALCLGILPSILDDAGILPSTRDKSMPSLYINSIFYEHAHHIYYPSRIVKEDRGEWVPVDASAPSPSVKYTGPTGSYTYAAVPGEDGEDGTPAYTISQEKGDDIFEPYHFESFTRNLWLTYRLSDSYKDLTDEELREKMLIEWHVDLETSRVWRYGALWECLVDGTTQAPGLDSTDWKIVQGANISLGFFDEDGVAVLAISARPQNVDETIIPILLFGQEDMSSAVTRWKWERQSQYSALDEAWANGTKVSDDEDAPLKSTTRTLHITNNDLPAGWHTDGGKVAFLCTAYIPYGGDEYEIINKISIV